VNDKSELDREETKNGLRKATRSQRASGVRAGRRYLRNRPERGQRLDPAGFLATYIEAGRLTSTRSPAPAAAQPARFHDQTKAIREWAANNGHKVSTRGRISAIVIEAYEAAHAVHTAAAGVARTNEQLTTRRRQRALRHINQS
jgi:hypothetical protein